MQFNYSGLSKNTSILTLASFVADFWKILFFPYIFLLFIIYIQGSDLGVLIAALASFFVMVLYAQNIQLFIAANRDRLTGLGNKNTLNQRLQKEIARVDRNGGYLTFLFFDIDNFKYINDTYGHKVGDCVLIEVANRLMAEMRNYDELIRYGGDEFCVICPQVKSEEASIRIKEKLHETLHFCYRKGEINILIETSLGVSTYPIDTNDLQELITIADHRMYEQKNQRKLSRMAHANING